MHRMMNTTNMTTTVPLPVTTKGDHSHGRPSLACVRSLATDQAAPRTFFTILNAMTKPNMASPITMPFA
jgi:hypothetical protein